MGGWEAEPWELECPSKNRCEGSMCTADVCVHAAGDDGRGVVETVPRLAGLSQVYQVEVMQCHMSARVLINS